MISEVTGAVVTVFSVAGVVGVPGVAVVVGGTPVVASTTAVANWVAVWDLPLGNLRLVGLSFHRRPYLILLHQLGGPGGRNGLHCPNLNVGSLTTSDRDLRIRTQCERCSAGCFPRLADDVRCVSWLVPACANLPGLTTPGLTTQLAGTLYHTSI